MNQPDMSNMHGYCVRCHQYNENGCQQFGLQCIIQPVAYVCGPTGPERHPVAAYVNGQFVNNPRPNL